MLLHKDKYCWKFISIVVTTARRNLIKYSGTGNFYLEGMNSFSLLSSCCLRQPMCLSSVFVFIWEWNCISMEAKCNSVNIAIIQRKKNKENKRKEEKRRKESVVYDKGETCPYTLKKNCHIKDVKFLQTFLLNLLLFLLLH